jgi:hypothetical protein
MLAAHFRKRSVRALLMLLCTAIVLSHGGPSPLIHSAETIHGPVAELRVDAHADGAYAGDPDGSDESATFHPHLPADRVNDVTPAFWNRTVRKNMFGRLTHDLHEQDLLAELMRPPRSDSARSSLSQPSAEFHGTQPSSPRQPVSGAV